MFPDRNSHRLSLMHRLLSDPEPPIGLEQPSTPDQNTDSGPRSEVSQSQQEADPFASLVSSLSRLADPELTNEDHGVLVDIALAHSKSRLHMLQLTSNKSSMTVFPSMASEDGLGSVSRLRSNWRFWGCLTVVDVGTRPLSGVNRAQHQASYPMDEGSI